MNKKLLATIVALGMVTMSFALLVPATIAEEATPEPTAFPVFLLNPFMSDVSDVGCYIAGVVDIPGATIEVDFDSTGPAFADGTGDFGLFTGTANANGAFRVQVPGLSSAIATYYFRVRAIDGVDTTYYPGAGAADGPKIIGLPDAPVTNTDVMAVSYEQATPTGQPGMLAVMMVGNSWPMTVLTLPAPPVDGLASFGNSNLRDQTTQLYHNQNDGTDNFFLGSYGLWNDGSGDQFYSEDAWGAPIVGLPAPLVRIDTYPAAADPTATVTVIPASPTNDDTVDITYTMTDGPVSVDIYVSDDGGTTWVYDGVDAAGSGSYTTTALGEGTWEFSACPTVASLLDVNPPVGAAAIEQGGLVIDLTAPTVIPTPADGATGVAIAAGTYVLAFSEPMAVVGDVTSDLVAAAGAWNGASQYDVTYNALASATLYTTSMNVGFTDLAGNPLVAFSFTFTTQNEAIPPVSTITNLPATYLGTLPDNFILQASATDGATTVESMEYSFDDFVTAGIPMVVDVYDVPAGTTSFTADLELHNYALGIYTISVRATDANSNQEIAPYVNADLTVSDTTAPLSTYTAPTPIDLKTSVTGTTETIRIDAHDFLEFAVSGGSANLWTNTDAAGWVDAGAMTADGSAAGSWHNYYTATITSAVPASIQYYVAATDGTNAANSATQTLNFADAALGPSFPAEVKGFANLYNGDHVAGYLPIAQVGALVTMQTYNATGVLITLGPVATDAIGRYLFTVQPDEYDVGGTVWVNYTNGAYLDFQVGVFAVDGAEVWANGTFGVPYDMHVDWIPFWDGNLPAPVSGSNTYFPGQAFYVNITVYDAYGNIAPGYYCWMEIDTNESSLLQDLWLGGVAPTAIEFDGIGGATTDGYYNNTVQLYTAGVWAIFVNATIDGAGTPATNLTWFGGANPTNPQLDPAGNVTNITHVQIAAGGFYWTPIADWNLVSVPMNVSVALLTGGNFLASTACQQVEDAAVFAGAGIGTTTIIMAQQILNQYPAQYNTFEYGVGGTDFTLGIDYAYWLFVDVDLTADGVYIQADELEVDDTIEIDAAGLNTVTLGTSWTMVNPSASWGNSSAWLGGAAVHIDLRGNTGLWSTGAGQLYTGGGWNGGANIAWYGNPATPLYPAAYTGYAEDPGSWVSTGTVIADSAVWAPAVAGGLWTAKSYEPAFYGQTDPGMGSANDADLLSYANGFIVWSTGGDITYYIDYDWALPGTDVPAF